ncbi:MAG TPA: methylenetetrahydrofolate--tRNA-(uracil(54)-C(5))-methyltransferase (FADH(2)-oxidizing) TrmFO [Syntrophales bacterium]|nr:methylenetetrahydrofolate--tRNA-(uracil(54)-C(5))-methyltransferase (FADH(2)-oxidizing) TrmFO [Syntrophales bacterium]
MSSQKPIVIIGGGLAGCEAAWQLTKRGHVVDLREMKPQKRSPAHRSPHLAELVCSNSLRSNEPSSAVGLLKEEMRRLDSLVMAAAEATAVPAGKALAVDRTLFSEHIEKTLLAQPGLRIIRGECTEIRADAHVIISTGPLTSDPLAGAIARLVGQESLHFYDAIAPIIDAGSIDLSRVFRASRYDEGAGDYLNCPLDEEQYGQFRQAVLEGRGIAARPFEDETYFEGCLPIEIMARRGEDTLRFGPMKPVGLVDPRTGREPHAVIQLRQENREGTMYNMVGFQTKLAWPEQERIFRTIPGLEHAEFLRFGSIHRNTYINSPMLLTDTLQLRSNPDILFAGQITGVEGYVESTATGLLAALFLHRLRLGLPFTAPPRTTALGALLHHVSNSCGKSFQPMNVNFGLFEPLGGKVRKKDRGERYRERALTDLEEWKRRSGDTP